MNKIFVIIYIFFAVILMTACELNSPQKAREDFYLDVIEQPKKLKYGFDLDLYNIVKKKSAVEIPLAQYWKTMVLIIQRSIIFYKPSKRM